MSLSTRRFFCLMPLLFWSPDVMAQIIHQTTYGDFQVDFHGYSIIRQDGGGNGHVMAGSRYNEAVTGGVDCHVLAVDADGQPAWELLLDTAGTPDYCLGLREWPGEGYLLTGATEVAGIPRAHLWKVDYAGNLVADVLLDYPFLPYSMAFGATLTSSNEAVVTGFVGSGLDLSSAKYALVLKVDNQLGLQWTRFFDSPTFRSMDFDMAEAVTENPDGYFVTGSLNVLLPTANNGPLYPNQQVMALQLDRNGDLLCDLSYTLATSAGHVEVGASVWYDPQEDETLVLANHSEQHAFTLTSFAGCSLSRTSPVFVPENYSGFTLQPDPTNSTRLLVGGMARNVSYQGYDSSGNYGTQQATPPFIASIDRTTLAPQWLTVYESPSHAAQSFGSFLSFFDGQQPLIFTPDMLVGNTDTTLGLVGYTDDLFPNGELSLQLWRTDRSGEGLCQYESISPWPQSMPRHFHPVAARVVDEPGAEATGATITAPDLILARCGESDGTFWEGTLPGGN